MDRNGKRGNYPILRANESSIETAGDSGVGRTFHDGATVGKYGDLVGPPEKSQAEFVGANLAQRRQLQFQTSEIERTPKLMDLHCIPAAQADGSSPVAVEVRKFAPGAGWALGVGRGRIDLPHRAGPEVQGSDTGFESARG